jgi:hypothetical protein
MMTVIETGMFNHDGTIVIDKNGHVWQTSEPTTVMGKLRATLMPGKRVILLLKDREGQTHRVTAIRIATSYVMMGQ